VARVRTSRREQRKVKSTPTPVLVEKDVATSLVAHLFLGPYITTEGCI